MRRDRLTFAMMIGVPIMQLVLFGYAINTDPKGLPTAIVALRQRPAGAQPRARALQNTGYFRITHRRASEAEARGAARDAARCSSRVVIPPRLLAPRWCAASGRRSLVAVDATDPSAIGQRAGRAAAAADARAAARPERPAARWRRRAAAVRGPHPPPLQPGGPDALQHRARTDRRDPDDDDGDADRRWR